jgi:hypothetical protein
MDNSVITPQALQRIRDIHQMSVDYNQRIKKKHMAQLLDLMHKHVEEIAELYHKTDAHFLVETGDLAVLCLEVLLEHQASIDQVILKCFQRYEKKLAGLIKETERHKGA